MFGCGVRLMFEKLDMMEVFESCSERGEKPCEVF